MNSEKAVLACPLSVSYTHLDVYKRQLLADLRHQVKERHLSEASELKEALAHCLLKLLKPLAQPLQAETHKPFVIMMVGVNLSLIHI